MAASAEPRSDAPQPPAIPYAFGAPGSEIAVLESDGSESLLLALREGADRAR
jgi:hypothetical protein